MTRENVLKSLLTKEWNTGKYTQEQFIKYVNKEFISKYKINTVEYCEIISYVQTVCAKQPTYQTKRKKQFHHSWYVYFYFLNENINSLCYIGKTYDIENRLNQHIRDNKKFKQIKYVLCCSFDTEQDALDLETYYIRHLQPVWNIDKKENPSKLYKLPSQKIIGWCERHPENLTAALDKISFENNVLAPRFQKVIDYISL